MKKLTMLVAAAVALGAFGQVAQAHDREHYRTREVYVVEDHHPVRRTVYVDERGRYFRRNGEDRVYIEHHWNGYPSRYYYRDGRPRAGVSISF